MTTLPPLDQLNALTRQGVTLLGTLETLLDQEHEALGQRDITQLQQLVDQKTQALAALEENNLTRNQLLTEAGITPDKAGLKQYCAQLAPSEAELFKDHWRSMETALHSVNEKNQRNELIISRNSRNLEQLLSILRGQNQRNVLYDQSGGKGNYSAQNRLGKA